MLSDIRVMYLPGNIRVMSFDVIFGHKVHCIALDLKSATFGEIKV